MTRRLTKIDAHIASWGGIITALTAVIGGAEMFPSALVGAALAYLNWVALRTLAARMAESPQKLGLGVFLALKSLALFVGAFLLIKFLPIQPLPFLAGMSGLFLGIATSTFFHALERSDARAESES